MNKYTKILLIILVIALLLRIIHIGDKAPGTDELHSINSSKTILEKGLSEVQDFGNPPGFFYFSGIILLLNSVLLLKLIMVSLGLLTIFLTYLIVKKLFYEKLALVASFLLAINPMHVLYSQHIRVYILLMVIYLISTLALYNLIKNKDNKNLILIIFTYAAAIYLHYFSAVFILAHIITLFYFARRDKRLMKKYVLALFITGIICLPLIPYFLWQYNYMITQGGLTTLNKLNVLDSPYPIYKFSSMMDISSTLQLAPYLIITAPLVFLAFLFGSYQLYNKKRKEMLFILLSLILPILILVLIGLFFPVYSFRYLTYLLPLYIIPIAQLSKNKKGIICLGVIVLLWILILIQYYSMVITKGWPINFAI